MFGNFQYDFANSIEKATYVTLSWNLSRNPDKISSQFAEENAKFDTENEKNRKFTFNSRKNVDDFWLKF